MQNTGKDKIEPPRPEDYLLESERRFHSVVQTAKDAIILADASGNIIAWNRAAQTIFGYREEEVMGQPLTMVMQATGTDGPSAGGVVNYEELDQPAVMRRNRSQTIEAMQKSGVEMLDIPAFLRKQAD